jgi:hypothetical protein
MSLVTFDPVTHTYTDSKGDRLISCSQLISKLKRPFDPTGEITERYAKKHGLTVDEVKKKWKETNIKSCDYGTAIHQEIEYYLNSKAFMESPYIGYVKQFAALKYQGRLFSERMLYCLENMVAGTSDLIERVGNVINIDDFKTNKKLDKRNFYGQYMLHEVSHLEDCNFNHYQLQLSIYGYLCELKGLTVGRLRILYFNPETQIMEPHLCRYMRDEVREIFKYKSYLKS